MAVASEEHYDVVILGGGPGGISAATEAARGGASVALIEADRVGGRANWHSLLPSKVWLTAADRLGARADDFSLGLDVAPGAMAGEKVDPARITQRIAVLSKDMSQRYQDDLTALDVELIAGRGVLDGTHGVVIGERRLSADHIILATGSGPIFFSELKPDGERIIAPRHMGKLKTVPDSLIMVGGGVTGAEFVYLFNRLGSRVTWLVDQIGVLPRSDRDIVSGLVTALTGRGVDLIEGVPVTSLVRDNDKVHATLEDGRSFRASYGFIAIGRRPDTKDLDLAAAGVEMAGNGAVLTDAHQQSSVSHIYAIGDAGGMPMTANRAMAQGRIAGRHVVGKPVTGYRSETVVEAIYTAPQVAQVGLTVDTAKEQGQDYETVTLNFEGNLKAQLVQEHKGVLKLVYEPVTGVLLGGAAVGEHATDLMTPLAVALERGASIAELASVYAGYPTLSELSLKAARVAVK